MGSSGRLSCGAGEVRSSCAWRGGARHFSPVMVGESGLKTREEGLSRFFSGYGRKPWVPSTYARDLRELFRVPLRSQGYCAVGMGSIPGSGSSPREGKGNPLQYSCLENAMDRGARQATVHGTARVGHGLALSFFLYRNRQCSTVIVCPSSHLYSLQLPMSIV